MVNRCQRSTRATRSRRLTLMALLSALLVCGLAAGCAGGGSDESYPAQAPMDQFSEGEAAGGPMREQAPTAPAADREVITTAWVRLKVDDPRASAGEVVAIVGSVGGRVDQRSEQPGTEDFDASAQLTVRVPAGELESVLGKIEALGEVQDLTLDSTDVTAQGIDLDARIRSLQRSVDRLLEIISTTTTAEDLISAENALAERQAELESFQSQRVYLSEQVALSTVTVNLSTADPAPTPAEGFLGGLQRGWESLLSALRGAVVATGVAVPWLGFLLVVSVALVVVVRALARRGRSTQPPQDTTAPSIMGPQAPPPNDPPAADQGR
jgi:hypothetical protein